MIQQRKTMPDVDRRRLNARRYMWTHPRKPELSLPQKTAAVVAVMEMGVRDLSLIAEAVGLTLKEVRSIDLAEDEAVRRLSVCGIPAGEFFNLVRGIRCPRCGGTIFIAPCVACQILSKRHEPQIF